MKGVTLLVVMWLGVFVMLIIMSTKVKPQLSPQQLALQRTLHLGVFTNALTYSGHTWTLSPEGFQFDGDTVWDTINSWCGPNAANYFNMISTVPSVYGLNRLVCGVTPIYMTNSGVVQFQLVIYPSDVRIESTTNGRYWSLFGANPSFDPLYGLIQWPTPTNNIVWQFPNTAKTMYLQFLSSGDLVIASINGYIFWSASTTLQPPIC